MLRGVPLSSVPDKRRTSKQRRAARNRAARDALSARVSAAEAGPARVDRASQASTSAAATNGGPPPRAGRGAAGTGVGRGLFGGSRGRRRPGDLAVLIALVLAVLSAVYVLFLPVPVDDRGEELPTAFRGVAIAAREAVTGQEMPDEDTTLIDARGTGVLALIVLPVAVAAFAVWANRRPDRSRLLTFALLALAASVLLGGGLFFFPTLIALAVASFQVRRADMPARAAERSAPARRGGRDVIDADAEQVDEPPDDEEDDEDGAVDDPLAELEAELEADEQARQARGGDGADGPTSS